MAGGFDREELMLDLWDFWHKDGLYPEIVDELIDNVLVPLLADANDKGYTRAMLQAKGITGPTRNPYLPEA